MAAEISLNLGNFRPVSKSWIFKMKPRNFGFLKIMGVSEAGIFKSFISDLGKELNVSFISRSRKIS